MAGEWREVSLASIMDVKHGFAFPGENIREEASRDILVTPGNFAIGGGFKGDKFKFFDGEVPAGFVLDEGDLVVTMTDLSKAADTLGYPALVPSSRGHRFLHNQRIGKVLIKDNAEIDKRFLFYLLRTAEYRHEVLASASGSTVKHTSPGRILAYKVSIPLLPTQRAIADVLGTLDDLIDLNRETNQILEEMARALFKSWFVDFDPVRAKLEGRPPAGMDAATAKLFPDHFEDSELGQIPRGWEVKPLPEVVEINPRRTLKSGTVAPYLDMKNLPTRGHCAEQVINREFKSGTKFQNGDTLLARITPCLENGKTGFVDFLGEGQVGAGSTEYIVLSPKPPLPPQFGYLLARSEGLRMHAIQNMTGTSGRQRVPAECFGNFLISVPTNPRIAECFDDLTAPLMAMIKANSEESRELARVRDTLLPKLLSGELRLDKTEEVSSE